MVSVSSSIFNFISSIKENKDDSNDYFVDDYPKF